jgi:hypothetical protein
MPLQGSGEMSFADVYNEMTGESQTNPPISITAAEQGQLQNSSGDVILLNQYYTPRPDGNLPTVFPTEWYLYCQRCNQPTPYVTIGKNAPTSVNLDTQFTYDIFLTNNGTSPTAGTITVTDTLQANLQYLGSGGSFNNVTVNGQVITATYTGVIPVNGQISLYIYVKTTTQGTYYNYASVSGGGETVTKTSNTTTTGIAQVTYTSSVTKRLVRTIQKNDCGAYGVGTYQEVYSPFFTATYTSTISQADADTNANNNATALCNQWLDANGQSVANQYGTCSYGYPNMTLSKSMPGAFNINQSGTVRIQMRILANPTSGQIMMSDVLPSGFEFVSMVDVPSPFSSSVSGRTVTFTTSNSLPIDYFGEFLFTIRGITVGNYTNFASAYGGNIINNYAQSNTVSTYVFGQPSFSFSRGTINNSFVLQTNAAPTDDVYWYETLTIGNQPSTNSSLVQILVLLPSHLRVVDDVSVFINETYFTFSQGALPYIIIINQKENISVPVGQYTFYVRINLLIDYYRMSSIVQPESGRPLDNLIINSSSTEVPRRQTTNFYNYISGNLVSVLGADIDWSNNYQFIPTFTTRNNIIPNDKNGLTWSYSINNNDNHSSQYPIFYDYGTNQFFGQNYAFAVNAVRDTINGTINSTYPFYNSTVFEYRIYYQIYYQGNKIYSEAYAPVYASVIIDKASNEPKFRSINLKIYVLNNGLYAPF